MAETENTTATEETTAATATETAPETAEATPETNAAPQPVENTPAPEEAAEEEISYHAVEKEGNVTAIWEMQGRKHLRTIAPRSAEGKHILSLFTSEHHDEAA